MICYCGNTVVKDNLCREHYIQAKEDIYLDNTDIDNLGIVKWAKDMLPEHTRDLPPKKQRYILYMLLSLYDPFYTRKTMRYRELIAFREFAKSTIIRIFTMYAIVHNEKVFKLRRYRINIDPQTREILDAVPTDEIVECKVFERFMCIVSEVGGQAEEFIVTIRDEFSTNDRLKYFYHFTIRKARDDEDGQWTRRAFKINKIYVLGLGSGQRIRGRIRGAYRLTTLFGDDIYSEESVITPEARSKTRRWWNRAAMNTVDTTLGKAFLVGTILHEDTVLVDNRKNAQWQTVEIPVMPADLFNQFVNKNLQVDTSMGICKLPYDDEINDFIRIPKQQQHFAKVQEERDWKLEWGNRVDLYELAMKYKEAVNNREISGFYQEFFHITVSPDDKKFKREYFRQLGEYTIFREFGINWIRCGLYTKPQPITIRFGIDLGTGSISGDDSALVIGGALPDGRWIVLKEVHGKYGYRDDLWDNVDNHLNRTEVDRTKIKKIGMYDEITRQAHIYYPDLIKIGYSGSEKGHIDAIRQHLRANNYYDGQVVGRVQMAHEGKKHTRIIDTLLNRYQSLSVYHANGLGDLEYQLEFLGGSVKDDIADSAEVAFSDMTSPGIIDYKELSEPMIVKKRGIYYPKELIQNVQTYDWKVV